MEIQVRPAHTYVGTNHTHVICLFTVTSMRSSQLPNISIPCVDQDALFSSMQSAIMKFSSKQPKVMETLGQ
jgi:hypothetical protein